jgi:hypothetical protein
MQRTTANGRAITWRSTKTGGKQFLQSQIQVFITSLSLLITSVNTKIYSASDIDEEIITKYGGSFHKIYQSKR